MADQQHIALLPVLADLNELRRELLGGEPGPQSLQVHRRREDAGAEDHMGALLQLHGHVQVQPGGQAVLLGEKAALVCIHPGQSIQPGVDAARRPAAGPQGIRPQQLLLRHLTAGRKEPFLLLWAVLLDGGQGTLRLGHLRPDLHLLGFLWLDHGGPLGVLQLLAGLADLHTAQVLQLVQQSLLIRGHGHHPELFHFDNGHYFTILPTISSAARAKRA